MITYRTAGMALLLTLANSGAVRAQHHGAGPFGNELGRVEFTVSCNAAAQDRFTRGVALLHSFWYEESERTFREAIDADPLCAMAFWGVAMSRLHPLWQAPGEADLRAGLVAALKADSLAAPTVRERGLIRAIRTYFDARPGASHATRMMAYEATLASAHRDTPEDAETTIFYALALRANADPRDATLSRPRRAGELLEPIFRAQPDHPGLAHYIIHAYDYPELAANALDAARRYARIAPAVPHARHMPSHIFTLLGLWSESAASNESAIQAGLAYERTLGPGIAWDQRLHALDYLVYAYLQEGRVEEVRGIVADLRMIERTEPQVSLAADYALAAIPARYALEREDWTAAARLPVRPAPFRAAEAITHYARAIGAARSGNASLAAAEVRELAAIRDTLGRDVDPYWARVVEIQRMMAEAWATYASGDSHDAPALARAAADAEDALFKHPVTPAAVLPARELLGDMLMEVGRPDLAIGAYAAALHREPERRRSLTGTQRAVEAAGAGAIPGRLAIVGIALAGTTDILDRGRTMIERALALQSPSAQLSDAVGRLVLVAAWFRRRARRSSNPDPARSRLRAVQSRLASAAKRLGFWCDRRTRMRS